MTIVMLALSVAMLLWLYLRIRLTFRRAGTFLPDSFLFGVGLYTAGALIVGLGRPGPAAFELAAISLATTASALAGATLFASTCGRFYAGIDFRRQFAAAEAGPLERRAIDGLLWLSGLVCVAFVFAVFSNSIVGALLSIASLASDSTLLEARKAITAGSEGYFAPGYVKQFRDILVPIALVALMAVAARPQRRVGAWFAGIAAVVAMLVSGQRLVFVVLFLVLLVGRHYRRLARSPSAHAAPRHSVPWKGLLALLLFYGVLTVLLGRVGPDVSGAGLLVDIARNLADRIVLAAPRENLLTYGVWHTMGPTGGESWLADLGGILPGARESLANVLHAATGGSYAGNSPLGMPADLWLAWGWPGVVLLPAVFAFSIGLLDLVLLSSRSALSLATRIYLFVVLPICYSPYLFVLYGGAVAIMLTLLAGLLRSGPWWRAPASAS